jgi:hypothetical protein
MGEGPDKVKSVAGAVGRHRELFNAGNREAWLANFVEEPYLEEPVGSGVRRGRQHFAAMFDAAYARDGGASIPPFDDTVVCGNQVAVYLRGRPLPGDVPGGIIEIFEVAPDGRIAGTRVFIDPRRLPALDQASP